MRAVKRFKRTGADTISYEAAIEDPNVLTKPFRISLPLSRVTTKNAQLVDYECYAVKEGPTVTVGDPTRIGLSRKTVNGAMPMPKNLLSTIGKAGSPESVTGPRARQFHGDVSVETLRGGKGPRKGTLTDLADGRIPYHPWARHKQENLAENHVVEESDAHRLLGRFPHASFTPFGFRTPQPPGEVVMVWDFMHAYRVIPTDGRPHLDAKTRLYMGDSRGHWEGRV